MQEDAYPKAATLYLALNYAVHEVSTSLEAVVQGKPR